jgi:hypothetical protein
VAVFFACPDQPLILATLPFCFSSSSKGRAPIFAAELQLSGLVFVCNFDYCIHTLLLFGVLFFFSLICVLLFLLSTLDHPSGPVGSPGFALLRLDEDTFGRELEVM